MNKITQSALVVALLGGLTGLSLTLQTPAPLSRTAVSAPIVSTGPAYSTERQESGAQDLGAKAALDEITGGKAMKKQRNVALMTSDGEQFMLERATGPYAKLMLPGSGGTVALREDSGSGGDVVFRTEEGQTLLRLTRRGNAILYDEGTLGRPVDLVEQDHTSVTAISDG